jgi:hypothetical protein
MTCTDPLKPNSANIQDDDVKIGLINSEEKRLDLHARKLMDYQSNFFDGNVSPDKFD